MKKSNLLKFILSSFIALSVSIFSHAFQSVDYKVSADELVGTPTVEWNNVDYMKEWAPNINDNGIPQEGYCILPLYPSNIAEATYISENLLTANISGCNVGDYILINGIKSKNVPGVIIYGYPQDGFFLYVPHNSVNFSDEYEYVTIEVLEGMSIDGNYQTVATRFEYRGLLGSFGKWEVNPEQLVKIKGEFSQIAWNNVDYSYASNQQWSGELAPNGAPLYGYSILAFFNEEGKSYKDSSIGDIKTTGRGTIGIGLNVDYKVKVNGVNIVDVEGSICYIYPQYGLFFYIPEASLTYNETYQYPVIAIESGLHFNNVYLPEITFEYRGEIATPNCWVYRKNISEYNRFNFNGVAEGWNNTLVDSSHNQTILQFGEYGVDYLRNDQLSDSTNLVNRYSDCGNRITVNGIPLWQVGNGDALVSYIHGYCYVYIVIPSAALVPTNDYKIVTLHIEDNTIFYDTLLNEVNLYLFNGKWVVNKPETPNDSDYDNALSLYDTFGSDEITLSGDINQLNAIKESSIDSFGLFFDYKLVKEDSIFILYALGNEGQSGLRIVCRGNSVSLYDSTQGNNLLGSAALELFNYDEWYSLFLFTRVVDNKLSICVAIDDITYIHLDNVNLANKNNIGNNFSLILGNGVVSFKTATVGADNKKPTLNYLGKPVYGVLSNTPIIDFSNKCSAFDAKDGDVTNLIEYIWPNESTTNGNVNKGVWEVLIVAKDKSNNKALLAVTVIATDKLEVTVTFDGQNPINYRVGDHIASIPDPVKEDNSGKTYRFIGWYYNDRLWDFENDYVIADMNLVSKFQESINEHRVLFTVEGLKDMKSFTLYFEHGTKIDVQVFAKDGYNLKAYVNDEEVETITVLDNINVKLVYESENTKPAKKGCGGNLSSTLFILSFISLGGVILLALLKKKGEKEYE